MASVVSPADCPDIFVTGIQPPEVHAHFVRIVLVAERGEGTGCEQHAVASIVLTRASLLDILRDVNEAFRRRPAPTPTPLPA